MSQPKSLVTQRGSALAGVLSLCLVLTLSATGYLTLVANAERDELFIQEDAATYFAAESGFLLGVRYVTKHDASQLSTMTIGETDTIMDFSDLDGFYTQIELTPRPPPNLFRIDSWATRGPGHDTTIIRGEVRITEDAAPNSCVVALSGWQHTVRIRN